MLPLEENLQETTETTSFPNTGVPVDVDQGVFLCLHTRISREAFLTFFPTEARGSREAFDSWQFLSAPRHVAKDPGEPGLVGERFSQNQLLKVVYRHL